MSFRSLAATLVAVVVCGTAASAATVVVPNANATVDANSNNSFPFLSSSSIRYQQVFESTEFGALTVPGLITAIRFRPDSGNSSPFSLSISEIEVTLSTTSAAPDGLDTVFANNLGVDATLVHSGALTLSTANLPGPGDTKAFDVVISLSTPFLYDPVKGNLLLDVRKVSSEGIGGALDANAVSGDPVSRSFGEPDSTTASSVNTLGLVAQFTTAPVSVPALGPSARALLSAALIGLTMAARRRATRG